MKTPKSLAEFKRNADNYTLTLVRHDWFPNNKLLGVPRVVTRTQTNGLWLGKTKEDENLSFLIFPKASDTKFTDGPVGSDFFQMELVLVTGKSYMTYQVSLTKP